MCHYRNGRTHISNKVLTELSFKVTYLERLLIVKSRPSQSHKLILLWATGMMEVAVAAIVVVVAEVANCPVNHLASGVCWARPTTKNMSDQ